MLPTMKVLLVQTLSVLSVVQAQPAELQQSDVAHSTHRTLQASDLQASDNCYLGPRVHCQQYLQLDADTSGGKVLGVVFNTTCDINPPAIFDFRSASNCVCEALVTRADGSDQKCPCTVCPTGANPVRVDCSAVATNVSTVAAAATTSNASVVVLDESLNSSVATVMEECTTWDCNGVCNGSCNCDDGLEPCSSCDSSGSSPTNSSASSPTNSSQELLLPTFTPVSEAPSFVPLTEPVAEIVQSSIVPSSIPFAGPSQETVETVPLFMAFNTSIDEEPSEDEFRMMQNYTMQFFDEYLEQEYATRYPDKFVRLTMVLDWMRQNAGIPEPQLNVYAAFSSVTALFDVCRDGALECYHAPPHRDILLLDLQKAVKTDTFLEGLRGLNTTSFESTSEAVLHPVSTLEAFPPSETCSAANPVAMNETTTIFMNQSTAEPTLLCQQGDDGMYTADFYKSGWLTVEGTGEVLTASTCGSAVEAMVTIYSSCLNFEGCISTLDEEDPYSYEEFCQDRCLATSVSSCAEGSMGSVVSWNSTVGHVYHLQLWQNRRSWGLWHQRFYFPLPCDGEAVLKVTTSSQEAGFVGGVEEFVAITPTEPEANITAVENADLQSAARVDELWRFPVNGHQFLEQGNTIPGATNATPMVLYSKFNDFCSVDLGAQKPGTWFGIKEIESDVVVCLSSIGADMAENATVSVVGGLYYKGGHEGLLSQYSEDPMGSLDGCVPSAEPYEDGRCTVAVRFRATSINGVLVQTDVPATFNISVFEAPNECKLASNTSASTPAPTLSPTRTTTSSPSSSLVEAPITVLLPSAMGENAVSESSPAPSEMSSPSSPAPSEMSSSALCCWRISNVIVSVFSLLLLNTRL